MAKKKAPKFDATVPPKGIVYAEILGPSTMYVFEPGNATSYKVLFTEIQHFKPFAKDFCGNLRALTFAITIFNLENSHPFVMEAAALPPNPGDLAPYETEDFARYFGITRGDAIALVPLIAYHFNLIERCEAAKTPGGISIPPTSTH